jgi:uncharacterized membrane protein YfcA
MYRNIWREKKMSDKLSGLDLLVILGVGVFVLFYILDMIPTHIFFIISIIVIVFVFIWKNDKKKHEDKRR